MLDKLEKGANTCALLHRQQDFDSGQKVIMFMHLFTAFCVTSLVLSSSIDQLEPLYGTEFTKID